MFIETNLHEIDYYKGWLVIYDKSLRKNYCVQLKDTTTNRNITRKQFKECCHKHGVDKTCNTFKKLYAKEAQQ